MRYLAFTLYGPLASWGDVAVGEVRPTLNYPGRSAIVGLLAAALGVKRDDERVVAAMRDGIGVGVAVYDEGNFLGDYHTIQVPHASALRERPSRTRADELAVPRDELETIVSRRDYRQDALGVVYVWLKNDDVRWTLEDLRAALIKPRFVLYLGRKSCPPAVPLAPEIIEADDIRAAIDSSAKRVSELSVQLGRKALILRRVAWEDGAMAGFAPTFSVSRKDEIHSRHGWQFGDRVEHVALMAGESEKAGGAE